MFTSSIHQVLSSSNFLLRVRSRVQDQPSHPGHSLEYCTMSCSFDSTGKMDFSFQLDFLEAFRRYEVQCHGIHHQWWRNAKSRRKWKPNGFLEVSSLEMDQKGHVGPTRIQLEEWEQAMDELFVINSGT